MPVKEELIAEAFALRRAAHKAEERYARQDLAIRRAPPPHGFKDWAKVLDARERDKRG